MTTVSSLQGRISCGWAMAEALIASTPGRGRENPPLPRVRLEGAWRGEAAAPAYEKIAFSNCARRAPPLAIWAFLMLFIEPA
jgi:hypothetical protein